MHIFFNVLPPTLSTLSLCLQTLSPWMLAIELIALDTVTLVGFKVLLLGYFSRQDRERTCKLRDGQIVSGLEI